ncbi:hypothetical protein NM688_g301 [Phlebia brevispora]|uniref:Uncharacterized protein n=1 Tax=Phlebia brevispora TaxID=194682 RepID=A0ACC1TEQ8_9APHY|nr:hypothetical protein NM688_g301 [Phlebia brevispora]
MPLPTPERLDVAQERARISDSIAAREEELAELKAQYLREHERISSLIRQLYTEYNATLFIARLPEELLSSIFKVYVAEHWQLSYHPPPSPCQWIRILHVCRDWRRIALHTPTLWTLMSPSVHEEYINFALANSGKGPLTVRVFPTLRRWGSTLGNTSRALLGALPRIRHAEFIIARDAQSAFSETEQTSSLRPVSLERLHLSMKTSISTLPIFSTADMPLLKSLHVLDGSEALVISLIRPTLTTLHVDFAPPADPLLLASALKQLPLLRHLQLSNIQTRSQPFPGDSLLKCTIPLPYLENLQLSGSTPSVGMAQLLDSFDFPINAEIVYISTRMNLNARESELVVPIIVSKATASPPATSTGSSPNLRFSEIHMSKPGSVDFIASRRDAQDHHSRLSVSLSGGMFDKRLLELVNLAEVQVMCISARRTGAHKAWRRLSEYNPLPNLKTLRISDAVWSAGLEDWLEMLTTPLPRAIEPSSDLLWLDPSQNSHDCEAFTDQYLFPSLKTLHLDATRHFTSRYGRHNTLRMETLLRFGGRRNPPLHQLLITVSSVASLPSDAEIAALLDAQVAQLVHAESTTVVT